MRLRQIEVFHAVYSNGSISAAARSLNVSQPAVSKVLRHTESSIGLRLFDLVRGRLVPTDEAHALFREVDDVFKRIGSLQVSAANLLKGSAGHLRIGVVPSLGLEVVPASVAAFRQHHPDVTLEIKTLHHLDMYRVLTERGCDIAIAFGPRTHPRLEQRLLAQGQLLVAAPTGTMPSGTTHVEVSDLDGKAMVGVTNSGPVGDIVTEAFAQATVVPLEIVSVSTYYVAAALARHGVGMAIVDEFTARALPRDDVELRAFTPAITFSVHALWLEDKPLSKLSLRFIEDLERALKCP